MEEKLVSDELENEIEYVDIDFDKIIHETHLAIQFDLGDEDFQWIPKAHIDMNDFDVEDHENSVPIKEWFAKNNGFI